MAHTRCADRLGEGFSEPQDTARVPSPENRERSVLQLRGGEWPLPLSLPGGQVPTLDPNET